MGLWTTMISDIQTGIFFLRAGAYHVGSEILGRASEFIDTSHAWLLDFNSAAFNYVRFRFSESLLVSLYHDGSYY